MTLKSKDRTLTESIVIRNAPPFEVGFERHLIFVSIFNMTGLIIGIPPYECSPLPVITWTFSCPFHFWIIKNITVHAMALPLDKEWRSSVGMPLSTDILWRKKFLKYLSCPFILEIFFYSNILKVFISAETI